MNIPSNTTVGASRMPASSRSFSRKRVSPLGREVPWRGSTASSPAALPDPPAMDFFMRFSSVDLLELLARPLDGVLRLRALDALGEHVDDDVLRVGLGGLRRRRPRVPEDPGVVGGGAEALHRLVDRAPQRMLLPELGRTDREAFRHLEPLPELLLAVEPLEEVLGQLLVLPVLHDPVVERGLVARRGGGTRGQPRVLDVTHHRLALLVLDLVLPTLGRDVDRGPVQRGADLAGQEGA